MTKFSRFGALFFFFNGLASPVALAQNASIDAPALFARVNGKELSAGLFDQHARQTFRDRFYHGTPPEAEVNKMLFEVGQNLVDRVLLGDEALARNIPTDAVWVSGELDKYERRYGGDPKWIAERAEVIPALRSDLELLSKIKALERIARQVDPDKASVQTFYEQNKHLFTEPAKHRISMILLKVDPSSPSATWDAQHKVAEEILARLKAGADFSALAKEFSGDPSAANGGRLDFIHQGMLSEQIESQFDGLKPGDLGAIARTLEGEVVFRLDEKTSPVLYGFESVEPRAKDLYIREQSEKNWQIFLNSLREKGKVEIGPSFTEIMRPTPVAKAP